MSERKSISVQLAAEITRYRDDLRAASRETAAFRDELRAVSQVAATGHQGLRELGQGALAAGALLGAGLVASGRAAIDFESSFAGVIKTVDGTEDQLADLAQGLRSLSKEIPVNVNELNAIAEAAGQLGIQRGAILGFTETMAALGVSTNLTGTQAATALARFAVVTGMAQGDVDRLGSSIVALGNNSATSEAEIVDMALRIAGAGATIGMSESDILAFAAALSSMGLESEAGGTAISRVMVDIASAVADGGDSLTAFADIAGMTVDDFSALFRQDATEAVIAFIDGLGGIRAAGGDVFGVLEQLGFDQVRVRDALLRTAGAGDLLRDSIDLSSQAWEDNNALTEEAARRYETTESRMQVAKNQLNDFAISVGQTFLPAIGAAAEFFGNMLDGVSQLPGPVAGATGVLGGLAASVLTVGGGLLVLAPRIHNTRAAIAGLQASGGTLGTVLGGLSKIMGPLMGVMAGAGIVLSVYADKKAEASRLTAGFVEALIEEEGQLGANTTAMLRAELAKTDALTAINKLGFTTEEFGKVLDGDAAAIDRFRSALDNARRTGHLTGDEIRALESQYLKLTPALADAREEVEALEAATRLEALAAAASTADRVMMAQSMRGVAEATARMTAGMAEAGTELPGIIPVLGKIRKALDEQLGAALQRNLDLFSGAPEEIAISVDEMVANLEERVAQNKRFDRVISQLFALGLDDLAAEILEEGVAAVDAGESIMADLEQAFRMEGMLDGLAGEQLDLYVAQGMAALPGVLGYMAQAGLYVGDAFNESVISSTTGLGTYWANRVNSQINAGIRLIKRAYGIASPSKVMAEQVGAPLAQGIPQGAEDQLPDLTRRLRVVADISADSFMPRQPVPAMRFDPASSSDTPRQPIEIHTRLEVDGRVLARAVDRRELADSQDRYERSIA